MGTLTQLPGWSPHWNTVTGVEILVGITVRTAVAAAAPLPSPLAENNVGARACTCTWAVITVVSPFRIFTVATPGAVSLGTAYIIAAGETAYKPASRAVPVLSTT